MRKKTNINILSVHEHFQYNKSNTANITHKQYCWIVFHECTCATKNVIMSCIMSFTISAIDTCMYFV